MIRWMIKRDMEEILAIERASFASPWSELDFRRVLRQRACVGMVVEGETVRDPVTGKPVEPVTGFMVYELQKDRIVLMNLAVAPHHRRRGAGRAMLDKLRTKLTVQRRRWLVAHVSEWSLGAHLFFRACRVPAVCVERDWYGDGNDAYRFVAGGDNELFPAFRANRFTEYEAAGRPRKGTAW